LEFLKEPHRYFISITSIARNIFVAILLCFLY